jgi:hypothetical protein
MTESHFALPGRNRCELLSTWAAGVANARILNVHQRHGDILKIANLSGFCGTRWMVNAIMIPTPPGAGRAYLMPVARVTALYSHHMGTKALNVIRAPQGLGTVASRRGPRLFLHAVNTSLTGAIRARLKVRGLHIASGRIFQIAADPFQEIAETAPDLFSPTEHALPASSIWQFAPASVTVVELRLEAMGAASRPDQRGLPGS